MSHRCDELAVEAWLQRSPGGQSEARLRSEWPWNESNGHQLGRAGSVQSASRITSLTLHNCSGR